MHRSFFALIILNVQICTHIWKIAKTIKDKNVTFKIRLKHHNKNRANNYICISYTYLVSWTKRKKITNLYSIMNLNTAHELRP